MSRLQRIITATDPHERNQSLDGVCSGLSPDDLASECADLDSFRRRSENLYERVRALFFLYAIHRFHLPQKLQSGTTTSASDSHITHLSAEASAKADHASRSPGHPSRSLIPFKGYEHLLQRRFEEAIDQFLAVQAAEGPSDAISSALAAAYHRLGFQTLADQVRRSVRSVRGNQWMFRMGHPADQPLRLRPELLKPSAVDGTFPILRECTPVRMDLTHCGWSDIFFLGMDFPEGAKVLNVSIDLGVHGQDDAPRPPVEAYLRAIEEPLLRLVSVDLGASADITNLAEVFDFAKDYLGLLKAAVIASGVVPPGIEGSGQSLAELLARLAGPGRGLELISNVNNIPKGSRLAVSTTLLAALVSVCMRATGQAASLTGQLQEHERRLVLARALLGEWLGGSGGGWQDSGGVWPGMKLIEGVLATQGDPELGISRGRLMPQHRILDGAAAAPETRRKLQDSLVLVHGGMAQNVGPILEMVTEKYLLRSGAEWKARQSMLAILDEILAALREGNVQRIGAATTRNFQQPIQAIIPWATNHFTETLIGRVRAEFRDAFWGFWMLGGMSGGGMGFIFAPEKKAAAQGRLQELMSEIKHELQDALPFAMEPVVYDFAINERGTFAELLQEGPALMPPAYYTLTVPALLRQERRELSSLRRAELDKFGAACRTQPELRGVVQDLFDVMLPRGKAESASNCSLSALLEQHGFDRVQHEQIRTDLKASRIGLAQNRLSTSTVIEDVKDGDVDDAFEIKSAGPDFKALGLSALKNGEVAVVTLAAGAGSRWTQGAGVVKALHPFCKLAGRHRTFVETHLAKSRRLSRQAGAAIPHIFTTSYLTHAPTEQFLARQQDYGYEGPLLLSQGKAVGLRLIPTVRDLRFMWEEMSQQILDEQQQKVRDSLRHALVNWARNTGEASDYTDNVSLQCLHPVGHWYEVPNLMRNGVLSQLLAERPQLRYLLLHNIDTLGADVDPALLGLHIRSGSCLTFEVITRRLEDRGGGLARVNGRVRLVEGLAMPREETEFALSYYNSNTCWIDLDKLLAVFSLSRDDLHDEGKVTAAIRQLAARMPTYITLKEVKKRWGHGQEDIFPVTQFEKLWVDMTALPEVDSQFVVVPRLRGQQLKDQAQLDGWLRDGSAAYVESLCEWSP
ncbi:MAG TPA: UTP--glucose-1-phosphate uridylyltransferase [Candidatus Acidoferrum sp.]|jgi:UDP-N-acetylglucosamine pyrophosphorylase|nr:UTP--glucose-1-phosphate uridylyltransferase [Candidatus Acidoferrum sp.]